MLEPSTVKMNILDKIIGWFNPKKAYERVLWRSGYSAGGTTRGQEGWLPIGGTAESINQQSRDLIRRKARDLERNSDIANAVISAFERNVVGNGFALQADTGNVDLDNQIESLFAEWGKPNYCDITGQQSFVELCTMAVRRLQVDGGILFIKTLTGDKRFPFQLQAREVVDLDESQSLVSQQGKGTYVINGVEVNEYGKPVAYYINTQTPDGLWLNESKRIEANRIIPLWFKHAPTQLREMSPLAKTINRLADAEDYVNTVSLKEKILACFAVFIKRLTPGQLMPGRGNKTDPVTGYERKSVTPGMIQELQPGDEAQAVVPNGQASNAREMMAMYTRFMAAGQGLSYESISRDMSETNYSSARQALLEDQRTYQRIQRFLIDHFLDAVYEEFLVSAVSAGSLKILDFWTNQEKYLKHTWTAPGWQWVDPAKEARANKLALDSGFESLASICAKKGSDWQTVLTQRAKELKFKKELEAEYGITFGKEDMGDEKITEESKQRGGV